MPALGHPILQLTRLKTALGNSRQPKLSDERFDETHELFERSSNQQQLILEWLTEFSLGHANSGPLSLLSIGCGSGILDNPLLQALAELDRPIIYTAIDPNEVACKRFREEFASLELRNVTLDVREETVESLSGEQQFDIVHAVHSLYYFEEPAEAIEQLLGRLKVGGRLVIFQAPKGELNQLADCFWFPMQDADIWFSERLESHLGEADLAFQKLRIDGRVDVSECFEDESPHGAMMLDFITQVDCNELESDARQPLLAYLKAIGKEDGNRVRAPHPVDAFVIAPKT